MFTLIQGETRQERVDNILEHVLKLSSTFDPEGTCVDFHLLLVDHFQNAVPYYDGDHVTTMIEGCLWDKKGLRNYPVSLEPAILKTMKDWKKS